MTCDVPATPEGLLARLNGLGLKTCTEDHPAAFTVAAAESIVGHLPGVHVKNLFLCDAKKKMWLVTAPWDRSINLKILPSLIGSKRLSFGSPERLLRTLGVTPGSVSPFCVINDPDVQVQVILDSWMMTQHQINAHPLINTKTTSIHPQDLLKFMRACGHAPRIVDLIQTN